MALPGANPALARLIAASDSKSNNAVDANADTKSQAQDHKLFPSARHTAGESKSSRKKTKQTDFFWRRSGSKLNTTSVRELYRVKHTAEAMAFARLMVQQQPLQVAEAVGMAPNVSAVATTSAATPGAGVTVHQGAQQGGTHTKANGGLDEMTAAAYVAAYEAATADLAKQRSSRRIRSRRKLSVQSEDEQQRVPRTRHRSNHKQERRDQLEKLRSSNSDLAGSKHSIVDSSAQHNRKHHHYSHSDYTHSKPSSSHHHTLHPPAPPSSVLPSQRGVSSAVRSVNTKKSNTWSSDAKPFCPALNQNSSSSRKRNIGVYRPWASKGMQGPPPPWDSSTLVSRPKNRRGGLTRRKVRVVRRVRQGEGILLPSGGVRVGGGYYGPHELLQKPRSAGHALLSLQHNSANSDDSDSSIEFLLKGNILSPADSNSKAPPPMPSGFAGVGVGELLLNGNMVPPPVSSNYINTPPPSFAPHSVPPPPTADIFAVPTPVPAPTSGVPFHRGPTHVPLPTMLIREDGEEEEKPSVSTSPSMETRGKEAHDQTKVHQDSHLGTDLDPIPLEQQQEEVFEDRTEEAEQELNESTAKQVNCPDGRRTATLRARAHSTSSRSSHLHSDSSEEDGEEDEHAVVSSLKHFFGSKDCHLFSNRLEVTDEECLSLVKLAQNICSSMGGIRKILSTMNNHLVDTPTGKFKSFSDLAQAVAVMASRKNWVSGEESPVLASASGRSSPASMNRTQAAEESPQAEEGAAEERLPPSPRASVSQFAPPQGRKAKQKLAKSYSRGNISAAHCSVAETIKSEDDEDLEEFSESQKPPAIPPLEMQWDREHEDSIETGAKKLKPSSNSKPVVANSVERPAKTKDEFGSLSLDFLSPLEIDHSKPEGSRLFDSLQVGGQLAWRDFSPLCQKIGWDMSVAQTLWWQTDTDRSGSLDKEEFLSFAARPDVKPYLIPLEAASPMHQRSFETHRKAGERLFSQLQHNGELAWSDFAPLCQSIGWDIEVAQTLWWQTDTDRSGSLDKEEFLKFASRPDVQPYLTPLQVQATPGSNNADGLDLSDLDDLDDEGVDGQTAWRQVFDRFQQNGQLFWKDFAPLCQKIGWDISTAQKLWWQTDTDRGGSLDKDEFLAFAVRPDVAPYFAQLVDVLPGCASNSRDHLRQAVNTVSPQVPGERLFKHLQQSGQLYWKDFGPLCQKIGWDLGTAQTLWWQADIDRGGSLDEKEFLRFASRPDVSPHLIPLENKVCPAKTQSEHNFAEANNVISTLLEKARNLMAATYDSDDVSSGDDQKENDQNQGSESEDCGLSSSSEDSCGVQAAKRANSRAKQQKKRSRKTAGVQLSHIAVTSQEPKKPAKDYYFYSEIAAYLSTSPLISAAPQLANPEGPEMASLLQRLHDKGTFDENTVEYLQALEESDVMFNSVEKLQFALRSIYAAFASDEDQGESKDQSLLQNLGVPGESVAEAEDSNMEEDEDDQEGTAVDKWAVAEGQLPSFLIPSLPASSTLAWAGQPSSSQASETPPMKRLIDDRNNRLHSTLSGLPDLETLSIGPVKSLPDVDKLVSTGIGVTSPDIADKKLSIVEGDRVGAMTTTTADGKVPSILGVQAALQGFDEIMDNLNKRLYQGYTADDIEKLQRAKQYKSEKERNDLLKFLGSPECLLLEQEVAVTPLQIDDLLSKCGGLENAQQCLLTLQSIGNTFSNFYELVSAVLAVHNTTSVCTYVATHAVSVIVDKAWKVINRSSNTKQRANAAKQVATKPKSVDEDESDALGDLSLDLDDDLSLEIENKAADKPVHGSALYGSAEEQSGDVLSVPPLRGVQADDSLGASSSSVSSLLYSAFASGSSSQQVFGYQAAMDNVLKSAGANDIKAENLSELTELLKKEHELNAQRFAREQKEAAEKRERRAMKQQQEDLERQRKAERRKLKDQKELEEREERLRVLKQLAAEAQPGGGLEKVDETPRSSLSVTGSTNNSRRSSVLLPHQQEAVKRGFLQEKRTNAGSTIEERTGSLLARSKPNRKPAAKQALSTVNKPSAKIQPPKSPAKKQATKAAPATAKVAGKTSTPKPKVKLNNKANNDNPVQNHREIANDDKLAEDNPERHSLVLPSEELGRGSNSESRGSRRMSLNSAANLATVKDWLCDASSSCTLFAPGIAASLADDNPGSFDTQLVMMIGSGGANKALVRLLALQETGVPSFDDMPALFSALMQQPSYKEITFEVLSFVQSDECSLVEEKIGHSSLAQLIIAGKGPKRTLELLKVMLALGHTTYESPTALIAAVGAKAQLQLPSYESKQRRLSLTLAKGPKANHTALDSLDLSLDI
mmetsp:Transcript_41908/g.82262  ORF Transcript_41908/g.82262 Transcript_41908/m.82262 type:complete len:2306 (-) Transcript_41908:147-7064(-)